MIFLPPKLIYNTGNNNFSQNEVFGITEFNFNIDCYWWDPAFDDMGTVIRGAPSKKDLWLFRDEMRRLRFEQRQLGYKNADVCKP